MQHDLKNNLSQDESSDKALEARDLAMRLAEAEADADDHLDVHVDEKWLISYADLMTLLFGLFVMLYVITVQNKGDVQKSFQEISQQMSRTPTSAAENQNISMQKPQKYTDAQFLTIYYESARLRQQIAQMMKELEYLRPKANLTSDVDVAYLKSLEEKIKTLEGKLLVANKTIADLNTQLTKLNTENDELKKQVATLEAEKKSLISQVEELTEIKSKLQKDLDALNLKVSELETEKLALTKKNEELLIDNDRLNSMVKTQKKRIEELEALLKNLNLKITALETEISGKIQVIAQLSREVSNLKNELQQRLVQMSKLTNENNEFRNYIAKLQEESAALRARMAKDQQQIKTLLADNRKLAQKNIEYASIVSMIRVDFKVPLSNPTRDLASLKAKLSNASVLSHNDQTKLQAELKTANEQVGKLTSQVNHLTNELKNSVKVQSNFLMIAIQWGTEKHDIDLRIKDPGGKIYSYKSVRGPASTGEFVMDSRKGPGMEAWHSVKFVPGEYEAIVDFYGNYGNEAPAVIDLFASTNTGKFDIAQLTLQFSKNKQQTIKFKLEPNGNVVKLK